ncbi:tetratricopeptide repeat protein [Streptomyces anulatus]|uniref:tetratricopeptide repeat protein n=1 Tax=Streptomyces anulatus TaxID=1892 RepID=UPI0036DAAFD8
MAHRTPPRPHLPAHLDRRAQRDLTTAVGTLDSLAGTLSDAGATSEELLLRRRILADRERVLGPDHSDILSSRNNLANALDDLGEHRHVGVRGNLHRRVRVNVHRCGWLSLGGG